MIGKVALFCKNLVDWLKSDRCFVKYFIDAFSMVNNNILLLTLLLLFVFTVSMYIIVADSHSANSLLTLVIVILIMAALASGLFYSMKKSIELKQENMPEQISTQEESQKKQTVTINMFYSGIGKYYISFLAMLVLFFILASILILGTFVAANYFICDIQKLGIDMKLFFFVLADSNVIETVLSGLDKTQQVYFRDWNRLFLISTQLFTFLLMFWVPEKMYSGKNIFMSLFGSVKKIVTDLPNALCIYLTILLLNYILAIFTVLFANNGVILFILTIISFYLLIYDFYAIFLYYKHKYIDEYERG